MDKLISLNINTLDWKAKQITKLCFFFSLFFFFFLRGHAAGGKSTHREHKRFSRYFLIRKVSSQHPALGVIKIPAVGRDEENKS